METSAQVLIQTRYYDLRRIIGHEYVHIHDSGTQIKSCYHIGHRIESSKRSIFAQIRVSTHRQLQVRRAVKSYSLSDALLTRDGNDISFSKQQGLLFSSIINEITILSKLNHPNIVKLYEVFLESKYIHLVLELCKGGELYNHLLQESTLPDSKAITYSAQILDAVRHMHANKVVHRAICVENIMFGDKERTKIKVISFASSTRLNNGSLTEKFGSPLYMAPEIFSGAYNEKCDIWSIGVAIYSMLMGSQPFQGETYGEIIKAITKAKISRPPQFNSLPGETRHFIKAMLKKENRPSANELLDSAVLYSHFSLQKASLFRKLEKIFESEDDKKLTLSNQLKYSAARILAADNKLTDFFIIEKLWKDLDTNRNGELGVSEFQDGLTRFLNEQGDVTEKAQKIVRMMDLLRNRRISKDVFTSLMQDLSDRHYLIHAFQILDRNNDDLITAEDIGVYINQESVDKIAYFIVEVLGKETVSFEDFCILISKFAI